MLVNQIMKVTATAKATNTGTRYATSLASNEFMLESDEPISVGGANAAPSPGDYLCMSLASCKAITLRMYANRKNWELGNVTVNVNMVKGDLLPSGNTTFFCEVTVTGNLDDQQRKRLIDIANACPISRLLGKPNDIITTLL